MATSGPFPPSPSFLKKSFIQSHFGSILCLYFFFPLLVLLWALETVEEKSQATPTANDLG